MAITFGNVPRPAIEQRIIPNTQAVEGHGWDNLGKRNPKFIALHRMVGTLGGTDTWFRKPSVASLTDFGMGIASIDGPANAGRIFQWNDYHGHRSGWASGPAKGAYGDGLAIINKYGINAVNRDGVSVEVSGTDEPLDAVSWKALVHLCAFLIDEMKIPYTSLPKNPHTGINVLIWHNEFTNGTGKQCPFPWLRNNTNRLYNDIKAFLKPYQEGEKKPEPAPAPTPEGRTFTVRFDIYARSSPGFWNYEKNEDNRLRPFGEPLVLKPGTTGTIIEGPRTVDGVDFYDLKLADVEGAETAWVQDQVLHTLDIKG